MRAGTSMAERVCGSLPRSRRVPARYGPQPAAVTLCIVVRDTTGESVGSVTVPLAGFAEDLATACAKHSRGSNRPVER